MKRKFEIWIGYYHLGQGSNPPAYPDLVAVEEARSFEVACLKYELRSKLKWVESADHVGVYIGDQEKEWFYDWRSNANSWTGKYFQTREEAQATFIGKNK